MITDALRLLGKIGHIIKPMVLVLEAERSKGEVDISERVNLNPVPFNQNIEHCHCKSNTALKIRPPAMHNLLQMIDQG